MTTLLAHSLCPARIAMGYYPIFVDLSGQPCLVVGGGRVAERKVASLLDAQARVSVISPTLTRQLGAWAAELRINAEQRAYQSGDMHGFRLVFAATSDEDLHHRLAAEARTARVLLNVVDRPALCAFIVPAVVSQGDLRIAVSTGGASPAMAKKIRHQLSADFGPEYAQALQLLARVRERVAEEQLSSQERQRRFHALVNSPLLDYLRDRKIDKLNALLHATLGEAYGLDQLDFQV